MKKKIVIPALTVLIAILFLSFYPGSKNTENQGSLPPTPPALNQFLIGGVDNGWVRDDYSKITGLGTNIWHYFSGTNLGWTPIGVTNDTREANINDYLPYVKTKMNNMKNYANSYTFLDRPKINYIGMGKRSFYECENTLLPSMSNYGFYQFNYHQPGVGSDYQEGSDVRGIYCQKDPYNPGSNAGWVVTGLKANREQLKLFDDSSDPWWVIPRLKIHRQDVSDNKKVCRIVVYDFYGTQHPPILDKDIYGQSFLIDGPYNEGDYRELWKLGNNNYLKVDGGSVTFNPGSNWVGDLNCQVDFQVYWYGECDAWFDRIKVENQIAYDLFGDNKENSQRYNDYQDWLYWEGHDVATDPELVDKVCGFYFDEFELCNVPALAEMNRLIDIHSGHRFNISPVLSNYWDRIHMPNFGYQSYTAEQMNDLYISKINPEYIHYDNYPLQGWWNANEPITKYPETLPHVTDYDRSNGMLGKKVSPTVYDNWLQGFIDDGSFDQFVGGLKLYDNLSKLTGKKILPMIGTHLLDAWDGLLREPTNEEISLMTNLALCYGGRGMEYFAYIGFGNIGTNPYQKGLMETNEPTTTIRYQNVYQQTNPNKWENMIGIVNKLNIWGPYLMSFDNTNRKSYIYRLQSERTQLTQNSYFSSASTYIRGGATPICDYPDNSLPMENLTPDCQDSTYLQIATFKNPNETNTEYFMVVNRRCSPVHQTPELSGERYVRVRFKANQSQFSTGNSWTVINLGNNSIVGTFNATQLASVNLSNDNDNKNGWFKPGEGRLYKIVASKIAGGSLACDETVTASSFDLLDTLYTNGYNLTIGYGTTINFTDSACIVVNGGSFTCGDVSQPTHDRNIIFKGVTGNSWNGITFNNCATVNINSVQFQNVKGTEQNINYALKFINCPTVNVNNCTFTNSDPQKFGAIEANYSSLSSEDAGLYIIGNTFNMNTSTQTTVAVIANASTTIPVMINNNYFSSTSNAATGVYLSFVNGIELSGNVFSNYNKSIELHYSNVDIIGNSITTISGNNGAKGIDARDYSTVNLTSNGTLRTGGLNIFDNAGVNVNNIYVNNSNFYLNGGRNIFGITPDSNSYHLKGTFPGVGGDGEEYETQNCFKVNNVSIVAPNLPIKDVKWSGDESNISFNFFSYDCSQNVQCTNILVDVGNSIYDTICTIQPNGGGDGEGSGVPSVQVVTPKKMYDSLCVLMRLRNFSLAKTKCYQLLTSYPDSSQGLNAVSKLFYLAVTRDTSSVNITECKTFLNNLILNHPNNLPLVRKCNYYIQKCKVKLKQYQSAMLGFQQIMQQNPYSYEALLASWDYSSTHLLDSINGAGGEPNLQPGEQEMENTSYTIEEFGSEDILSLDLNALLERMDNLMYNDDDKDSFTKEQRKTISTSVITALGDSKQKSKNTIEILTKKSMEGNIDAKVELKVINTLKEVVKIKKPKTILEHIKTVNQDIQKLNTVKNDIVKNSASVLPESYSLSQNYPNPFNPVTKINYELPKDGRVKLVIYDILGREMKTLVNELKQAGRYTVEFNGSQYASGVYFYRIQVEGGKSYTSVKKMVLVK